MHLTIGVGKERVTVAEDTGTLVIAYTCGVPECPHVVAVEIGDRAAVSPKEVGELVAAAAKLEVRLLQPQFKSTGTALERLTTLRGFVSHDLGL